MAAVSSSSIVVADTGNHRIQKFLRVPPSLYRPDLSAPQNGALIQGQSATLQWTDTNSSPQENGYRIRFKPSDGNYSYAEVGTNVTSHTAAVAYSTTYFWNVQAVGNGGGTLDSAWANSATDFSFTTPPPPPPTVTGLNLNAPLPVLAGTEVIWTASATGGVAPLEYRFYVYSAGAWTMVQDYSTFSTCSWTPTRAGQYNFAVWVRNSGSTAPYDAYGFYGYFDVTLGPILALSPNPSLPQTQGTAITWTANAKGGIAPLEYRFYVYFGGAWTMVQDYSANETCSWTPMQAGQYNFAVWVRNSGSAAPYDFYKLYGYFDITPASVSLSPSPGTPQAIGTPILWTATATGGVAPLEYRFYVYFGGAWTMVQDYSANATCSWTPMQAGRYSFAVWVKMSGSAAPYDFYKLYGYFDITPASVSLSPSPGLPQAQGTPILWTATATGGVAPLEYRFYVYFDGAWTMVQDYSANATCLWTPTQAGQYNFAVWVRNSGSAAPYDFHQFFGYFEITG